MVVGYNGSREPILTALNGTGRQLINRFYWKLNLKYWILTMLSNAHCSSNRGQKRGKFGEQGQYLFFEMAHNPSLFILTINIVRPNLWCKTKQSVLLNILRNTVRTTNNGKQYAILALNWQACENFHRWDCMTQILIWVAKRCVRQSNARITRWKQGFCSFFLIPCKG